MHRPPILFFVLAISTLLAPATHAQTHFSACLDGAGNVFNATVIVPVESIPDVGGVPLAAGSEIAVFSSDPSYPDLCVGVLTWQGTHGFIVAWGDDAMTSARDGLLIDEELRYRVWDSASGVEFAGDLVEVSYAQGDGRYSHEDVYVLADLSVTVLSPPEAPTLASPSDAATGVPVNPILEWNSASGAESYGLQVATDAGFSNIRFNQGALTETSHQVTGLDHATQYYWRVRAGNGEGNSPWSAAWHFTTGQAPVVPPEAPTLASPSDEATGVPVDPTLEWNSASGADSYRLQVATEIGFTSTARVVEGGGLTGTTHQVTGLAHATQYYWRVRAGNTAGESPWSATFVFTTEQAPAVPPEAPTLASPSDEATGVPVDPTLTWNAAAAADSYRLQLATDAGFVNRIVNQGGLTDTLHQVTGLDHATPYYWRVKSSSAGGSSPWSATRSFTTGQAPVVPPEAPTLASPSDEATGVPVDLTLEWNASNGAESYRLQVATEIGFTSTSRVVEGGGLTDTTYQVTGLDHATPYYWRVRAGNTAGESPWSATFVFTTGQAPAVPPEAPTLASPSDEATGVPVDPTLTWNAAAGADSYRLQLATDAGFATILFNQGALTGTSHQVTGLDYTTIYYWRVRASNGEGDSPWSAARRFTTGQAPVLPPEAPTLVSPSDEATGVSVDPTLRWNASNGAESYRLQVATDADFNALIVSQGGLTGTTHQVTGLDYATQYYWRVRASNTGGAGSWSPMFDFTTEQAPVALPEKPGLLHPDHRATDVPVTLTFSWRTAAHAETYHLQVSTSRSFSTLALDESGLTGTALEATGLAYTTRYYWRVRASNAAGNGPWSGRRKFTTEQAPVTPPDAPALTSPSDGAAGVSVNPTLTWNSPNGADSYRLQVATDANFANVVFSQSGLTSTSRQVAGLNNETQYYWRVQASNAGGYGPWSTMRRFTTEQAPVTRPPAPTLVNPQAGALGAAIDLTFTWNAAPGADVYRLQVATSRKFRRRHRVIDKLNMTGTSFEAEGLQYGKTYYWRVQARNAAGNSPYSEIRSFTTEDAKDGRIAAPPLVDPIDGSTSVSTDVLLIWAGAGGASGYHLQLSAQDDFSRLLVDEGDLAGTSYEVEDLDQETTYYWRIRARNYFANSDWSYVRHFTTGNSSGLLAPRPITPAYAATDVAIPTRFTWALAPFATTYRVLVLQAASAGGGDDVVIDTTGIASLRLHTDDLEGGIEYTWRVKAVSDAGESPWSSMYRFTTYGATATASETEEEIPGGVHLHQNYPNPFNPETTIAFELPATMPVTLTVYDLLGQEIATLVSETLPAGRHQTQWDARDLPSGLYLYQLIAGNNRVVRTLALVK